MKQNQISFQLTEEEKNLLEEVTYLEPWLEDAIDHRRRKGDQYQVRFNDEEYEDCIGALLFEADQAAHRHKKEELILLVDKMKRYWGLKKYIHEHNKIRA